MSMCLLRFPAWLNDLFQMEHLWGFSPVSVIMCFLRTSARLNDVSHCSQMCSSLSYGWSYVYPIVLFLSTVNQQVLFQNSSTTKWFETLRTQEWGFSPVWMNMCLIRIPAWLNYLGQLYFFFPMCTSLQILQCDISSGSSDEQPIWMIFCAVHICATSLQWVSKCVASFLEDMMDLTQKVQMCLLAMSKISIQLSFPCWQ